jgi:hypothetical protein
MAFTAQQKQALTTWLQANLHKGIHEHTYREGIKDGEGKAVYATGYRDVPVYDEEGNQTGTEQVEYQYRTYNEVTKSYLFFDEVILRVQAKAQKHGYDPDVRAVRDLLRDNWDTIKTWIPANTGIMGGRSHLRRDAVLAEEPDA